VYLEKLDGVTGVILINSKVGLARILESQACNLFNGMVVECDLCCVGVAVLPSFVHVYSRHMVFKDIIHPSTYVRSTIWCCKSSKSCIESIPSTKA
jgi:hypothetical protein